MFNNSYKTYNRPALTLVEVITSVALLSTLLVGMLTAYSRHVRQINRASDLKVAVKLSDQILADWFRSAEPIASRKSGTFSTNPEFRWQLTVRPAGAERQIGAQVLVFQVFKTLKQTDGPILKVELLDTIREEDSRQ